MKDNSLKKVVKKESLDMLKILEDSSYLPKATDSISTIKASIDDSKNVNTSVSRRRKALESENAELNRYDGLLVDYGKFSNLTKGVLKQANVVRQKSLRSPRFSCSVSRISDSRELTEEEELSPLLKKNNTSTSPIKVSGGANLLQNPFKK